MKKIIKKTVINELKREDFDKDLCVNAIVSLGVIAADTFIREELFKMFDDESEEKKRIFEVVKSLPKDFDKEMRELNIKRLNPNN